jgi:hypothetical protein
VLIAALAGIGIERLYLDRLEAVLGAARDQETLVALARDLDHLDAATVPLRRAIAFDAAATYPWLLRHPPEWSEMLPGWRRRSLRRAAWPVFTASGLHRLVVALGLEASVRAVSHDQPAADIDPEVYRREVIALRSAVPMVADFARLTTPMLLDAIRREQLTRSSRMLGRLAVELSLARAGHGRYPTAPPELPVSPATGETALYRLGDAGAIEIAFPEAEAIWEAEQQSLPTRRGSLAADLNLRWRLPP